ncbi:O-antigen polymerase [Vagococcus sp. WN89Y]|uniref:O-antigen polymerase n=1 Tax=Vagococcus sp. WN89Y TaxID=3457258 RepID=UPI003FCE06F2
MSIFLLSPGFIYAVIWLFTIILYSLGLTTNITPMSSDVVLFLLINIVLGFIFALPFLRFRTINSVRLKEVMPSYKVTKRWFFIWCLAIIPDAIVAGGIPMLLQLKDGYNYTEFGIPTYHGIVNMIFLFVFPSIFYHFLLSRKKILLMVLLLMCIWEMLVFRRGILMSGLVEVFFLYFIYKRITIRVLIAVFSLVITVVLLFGVVGDIRGAENPYNYMLSSDGAILTLLPSGFTWFYVYITAGLANLTYNLPHIIPAYDFTSFQDLFPSVIRNLIYSDLGFHDSMILVDANANVSTMFEKLVPDLGIAGSICIVFTMLCLFNIAYNNILKSYRYSIYPYTIAIQCVIFSGFYNIFFIQTYFLLFILTLFLIRIKIKTKSEVNV